MCDSSFCSDFLALLQSCKLNGLEILSWNFAIVWCKSDDGRSAVELLWQQIRLTHRNSATCEIHYNQQHELIYDTNLTILAGDQRISGLKKSEQSSFKELTKKEVDIILGYILQLWPQRCAIPPATF